MISLDDIAVPNFIHMGHHDPEYEEQFQIGAFAGRIQVQDGTPDIELETYGRIKEGLLWDTKNQADFTRFWSYGHPGYGKSGSIAPVKGPSWADTEGRLSPITDAATPNDQDYPDGWAFYVDSSLEYNSKPSRMALPGFLGIVAPHFNGGPDIGTPVFDVEPGGKSARIQSLMRVYSYPLKDTCVPWTGSASANGLALQLGRARDGMPGYLVFAEQNDKLSTTQNQLLGVGSRYAGGPFNCGGGDCPHLHGPNADGELMYALHWSTGTLYRGGIGDGPLNFGTFYDQNVFDAPFVVKSHLRWNPEKPHNWACGAAIGRWDFQSESHYQKIFPPKIPDPVPPQIPGEGFIAPGGDGDAIPFPRELFEPPMEGFEFGLPEPPDATPQPAIVQDFKRISANPKDQPSRSLYGTSLEMAIPGIVGRPQNFIVAEGIIDLRNQDGGVSAAQFAQWIQAPVVYREECFGGFIDGDQWITTLTTKKGESPYEHVSTGPGSRVFMPPELRLEFWDQNIDGLSLSETNQIMWNTALMFATPRLSGVNSPGGESGFKISKGNNGLTFEQLNPDGSIPADQRMNLLEGGDFGLQSNTGLTANFCTSGGVPVNLNLKSSEGTLGTPTISGVADVLGKMGFFGYDTFSQEMAAIKSLVTDATTTAMHSRMDFEVMEAGTLGTAAKLFSTGIFSLRGSQIRFHDSAFATILAAAPAISQITATIQAKTGTLALLSDISASGNNFSYKEILGTETITIAARQQMIIVDGITITGTLIIDGELELL